MNSDAEARKRLSLPTLETESKPEELGLFPCAYEPGFVPKEKADQLFERLRGLQTWTNSRFLSPGVVAFSDDEPRESRDLYGAQRMTVCPWADAPPELTEVREMLQSKYGHLFPYVLLNRYENERIQMCQHFDTEYIGSLYGIATISLGAERPFMVIETATQKMFSQQAEHGSLLMMPAGFQETHTHGVPEVDSACGIRISLTFRNPVRRKTRVVRVENEPFDVYMGSGLYQGAQSKWDCGEWGNPFSDKLDSKAEYVVKSAEVMPRFREWFENRVKNEPGFANKVRTLSGQILGCWCPEGGPCHAKVVASWADKLSEEESD